jgi:hypothetical protein
LFSFFHLSGTGGSVDVSAFNLYFAVNCVKEVGERFKETTVIADEIRL